MEPALCWAVLGLTLAWLVLRTRRLGPGAWAIALVCMLGAAAGEVVWTAGLRRADASAASLRAQLPWLRRSGFVSSDACRSCHPEQYSSWHRTYHRTMTQV